MSVKQNRSRYHAAMAKQGLLIKLRGKQRIRAQEELNQLWEVARKQGAHPFPVPGRLAAAALVQDGECQIEDPFASFWGPIGRPDGWMYYCCTHPTEHCFRLGLANP